MPQSERRNSFLTPTRLNPMGAKNQKSKDRARRWAIAPPASAESSTIGDAFRFELMPVQPHLERDSQQREQFLDREFNDALEPPIESLVRPRGPDAESPTDSGELRASQRATEVSFADPADFDEAHREADTVPAPPNLLWDLDDPVAGGE